MKTVCLALTLLGCCCPVLAGEQQAALVGIVRSVSGSWTFQGHAEPLRVGQPVNKGDVPYITRSTRARLVIGLVSSADPWEKDCTETNPCEGPYSLPGHTQGSRFFNYLLSYWDDDSESKRPAIFAGARDATPGPQHAVLVIHDDSIALGPALSRFPAGRYTLKFTSLGANAPAPAQVEVAWEGSSTVVPAVAAGFYALDAYTPDGEHVGSHAAILVIRSSDTATQKLWEQSLTGIQNAAGPNAMLTDTMRLATVLALKDGELR